MKVQILTVYNEDGQETFVFSDYHTAVNSAALSVSALPNIDITYEGEVFKIFYNKKIIMHSEPKEVLERIAVI